MAGVVGSDSEPAVLVSSTRDAEELSMVVSSGCNPEAPLAPGPGRLVELDMVARWNWFWERAVIWGYTTGVRIGNEEEGAKDRSGCSGEWEIKLNDLHCTKSSEQRFTKRHGIDARLQDGIIRGRGRYNNKQE